MSENLFTSTYIALLLSPYIGLIALVPFIYEQYKNTRVIIIGRSLYFYLMIIFWLSAFFMTMLPFPSKEAVEYMYIERFQLIPFHSLYECIKNPSLNMLGVSHLAWLYNWYLLSPILNIMMLLPVGFFMRLSMTKNLFTTTIVGFLSSLFFETVQATGIFFIYSKPYRTFDVDDIMTNTLGAVIGWLLVPYFRKWFPKLFSLGKKAIRQGSEVSMRRRIPALLIDQCLILFIGLLLGSLITHTPKYIFLSGQIIALLLNLITAELLYKNEGYSLGYKLAGLKLKSMKSSVPSRMQCIIHNVIQCLFMHMPLWMAYFMRRCYWSSGFTRLLLVLINVIIMLIYMSIAFSFLLNAITHGSTLFFDRLSATYLGLADSSKSLDGLTLIKSEPLSPESVTSMTETISDFLSQNGVDKKAALRVKLLADGAMNDWLVHNYAGNMCELRFDNRLFHKTLFLSVYVPENSINNLYEFSEKDKNSYIYMLSGIHISYEIYTTESMENIAIDIP